VNHLAGCRRTGAFAAGLPVQPVLIRYRWQFRNPHFTGSMLSTVLELMTSWYNVMEVKELPVHYPTTKEQADARVFADNMQALMATGGSTVYSSTGEEWLCFLSALMLPMHPLAASSMKPDGCVAGLGIPKVAISNRQVLHVWKRQTTREKVRVQKQPRRTQVAPATASSRGAEAELGALVRSSAG